MIYFDNAASSYPKPKSVAYSMNKWLLKNGSNPGRSSHDSAIEAARIVYDTRCIIAKLFGVSDAENIAFVPNATYGINMLLYGLLKRGDHVIMTDLEHNSVLRPIYLLSEKDISFSIAETDLYDDNKTVASILNCIKNTTRLVICTQCSNVCGKIMPIEKIRNSLPADISLLVDGSQGAGIVPIDLERCGVDYYCAPSHKGLLGPQGSGFVAVLGKLPEPLIVGGTGSESFNKKQPSFMPDILESGTLPTPVIVGFKSGLEYIERKTISEIYENKKILTDYFYSQIKKLENVINYINYENGNFIGAFCFNIKGANSAEVGNYLNSHGICVRGGLHCAPLFHKKIGTENIGAVRVSFGIYNTKEEINRFIFWLKNFKKI